MRRDPTKKGSSEPKQFLDVAPYYDRVMQDVAYGSWVAYIHELLSLLGCKPKSVLDLACGTGTVSLMLAEMGYEVVGVDFSEPMIEQAKSKAALDGSSVRFMVQDAALLSLPQKRFDLAISLFDSLNYITDPERLQMALSRTFRHLNPQGVFIFDVNTEFAFAKNLFDQRSRSNPQYVWKSSYDRRTRICTIKMTFKITDKQAPLEFEELHLQRAYSDQEITSMLRAAGFFETTSYHAYTLMPPGPASDRVFYVARKGA